VNEDGRGFNGTVLILIDEMIWGKTIQKANITIPIEILKETVYDHYQKGEKEDNKNKKENVVNLIL